MAGERLAGMLIVATPMMRDPNFDRTVVLMLDHNADGALGVVLNRPSATEVRDPLPEWVVLAAEPPVIFVGGPVAPGSAICLARARGAVDGEGWQPLFGPLGTVDLSRDPDRLRGAVDEVRVFAGYAGWGPQQLEGEIEVGAWFVLPSAPGDAITAEPRHLWREVLRRQGGVIAAMAAFPGDLSVN